MKNKTDLDHHRHKTPFSKGLYAEKSAQQYLLDRGYIGLAHRYKTKFGELDLVMHQDNHLVFFEVKQRQNLAQGLLSITPRHRQRLWNAGEYFLQNHKTSTHWLTVRFDLMVVFPDLTIHHFFNILSI